MSKPWPYVVERGDKEITIDAPVPVWVDYDDVDQDEAKRVAALVSNAPALLAVLERVLPLYQSFVDDSGGCDHSVGICMCEDFAVLSDIRALLKSARGNQS